MEGLAAELLSVFNDMPDEITSAILQAATFHGCLKLLLGMELLDKKEKLTPEEDKIIQFEVRPWCTNTEQGATVGNIFYGDKGVLVVEGYDKYKTYLGKDRTPGKSGEDGGESGTEMDRGAGGTDGHFANFIERNRVCHCTVYHK